MSILGVSSDKRKQQEHSYTKQSYLASLYRTSHSLYTSSGMSL